MKLDIFNKETRTAIRLLYEADILVEA